MSGPSATILDGDTAGSSPKQSVPTAFDHDFLSFGLTDRFCDVFWMTDWPSRAVTHVSRAYEKIWGRPCSDLYNDPASWSYAIHDEDRKRVVEAFGDLEALGCYDQEYRITRPDGAVRWIHARGFPIRNASGSICRVAGIAEDITERKRAEHVMRVEHRILEMIARGSALSDVFDALCVLIEETIPQSRCSVLLYDERADRLNFAAGPTLSDEFAAALDGLTVAEGFGGMGTAAFRRETVTIADTSTDPRAQKIRDLLQRCGVRACWTTPICSKEKKLEGTFTISRSTPGAPDPFELELLRAAANLAGLGIQRQRAEEDARCTGAQLAHFARLTTMGEMAAGIAHELNQPLAAIMNFTESCKRRLGTDAQEDATLVQTMDKVTAMADRAGAIIRRLKELVQKREPRRMSVDLNALVREVLALIASEVRLAGVTLELRLEDGLPPAFVDPVQIQQVVLNLTRNAIEALRSPHVGERRMVIGTSEVNHRELEFVISDTGSGLSAETVEHLFEPFTTTKSHGLGMGLSISKSIVGAHGGRLSFDSQVDHGATFRFTVPFTSDVSHAS
ncbi:MAG: PAS domain-containing protein [Planctomycetes bacterium]|nr:PAS domain-containing protein [Planctomycetota bacterium]